MRAMTTAQRSWRATMWQSQPQKNRPKRMVRTIASRNMIAPALTTPTSSVSMASEGSMGETVEPTMSHWIMWATMRRLTRVRTAVRQRAALECPILGALVLRTGRLMSVEELSAASEF
jgi:hypothetical protein